MPIANLSPYIHMNGTAEKAIELYRSVLQATPELVTRYGDVPAMNVPADLKSWIMHAQLRIGPSTLMLNDTTPDRMLAAPGNMQIALQFTNLEEMTAAFAALGSGGTVLVPLHDAIWGAKFGILTDAFGVRWIFNCDNSKAEADKQ